MQVLSFQPPSLAITREPRGDGGVNFSISNGDERAITGLPLVAVVRGTAAVTVNGQAVAFENAPIDADHHHVIVAVDVPTQTTISCAIAPVELGD